MLCMLQTELVEGYLERELQARIPDFDMHAFLHSLQWESHDFHMTGHMIPTQDAQGGGCGGGAGPSAVFLRFSLFQTTDAPSQGSKTLSLPVQ